MSRFRLTRSAGAATNSKDARRRCGRCSFGIDAVSDTLNPVLIGTGFLDAVFGGKEAVEGAQGFKDKI
jgi:hypothetical protein